MPRGKRKENERQRRWGGVVAFHISVSKVWPYFLSSGVEKSRLWRKEEEGRGRGWE